MLDFGLPMLAMVQLLSLMTAHTNVVPEKSVSMVVSERIQMKQFRVRVSECVSACVSKCVSECMQETRRMQKEEMIVFLLICKRVNR